jgi:hypothetical protein
MGEGLLHNQRVVHTIAYTLCFDISSHSQNRTSSLVSLDRDSRDRKEPTLHPYVAHFRHSASPDRTREELCRDLRTQVLGRILRVSSSCYWRSFLAVSAGDLRIMPCSDTDRLPISQCHRDMYSIKARTYALGIWGVAASGGPS